MVFSATQPPRTSETANPAKMDDMKEWVKLKWYQYQVNSAIYMLEPWEKKLFNIVLLGLIVMSFYTAYLFLPSHIKHLLELLGIL